MKQFLAFNRYLLLGFWLVFIVSQFMPGITPWPSIITYVGLILLAIHAVELILVFKPLKAMGRAGAKDCALVLLLGLLHWKPLLKS